MYLTYPLASLLLRPAPAGESRFGRIDANIPLRIEVVNQQLGHDLRRSLDRAIRNFRGTVNADNWPEYMHVAGYPADYHRRIEADGLTQYYERDYIGMDSSEDEDLESERWDFEDEE
jgi:hypothetical protein